MYELRNDDSGMEDTMKTNLHEQLFVNSLSIRYSLVLPDNKYRDLHFMPYRIHSSPEDQVL